ncbi:hypothetical protein AMTRI_Chr01g135360 [Amborella trichopoda]
MVYEATARLTDPVYGCTGAIFSLLKQANDLRSQLAKAMEEIAEIQEQCRHLMAILTDDTNWYSFQVYSDDNISYLNNNNNVSMG